MDFIVSEFIKLIKGGQRVGPGKGSLAAGN